MLQQSKTHSGILEVITCTAHFHSVGLEMIRLNDATQIRKYLHHIAAPSRASFPFSGVHVSYPLASFQMLQASGSSTDPSNPVRVFLETSDRLHDIFQNHGPLVLNVESRTISMHEDKQSKA